MLYSFSMALSHGYLVLLSLHMPQKLITKFQNQIKLILDSSDKKLTLNNKIDSKQ